MPSETSDAMSSMSWTALVLLLAAVAGSGVVRATGVTLRKCCPAGQQLSIDLQTCTPLSPRRQHATDHTYYATDNANAAKDRARRGLDDWGWLPDDAVITDSTSFEQVTLDELRRASREAERPTPRPRPVAVSLPRLPRAELGAFPPCGPHDTELLFWDGVQVFTNGSLLVTQRRPDLFRPPGEHGSGSDDGERTFLFAAGAFCMDRLSLAPVVAVPLEAQDMEVERGVEDAVNDEDLKDLADARNETEPVTESSPLEKDLGDEEQEDEDSHHVILLCPCQGARCVRKCCHPQSVLQVDAKGDTACQKDPLAVAEHPDDVASAADANRARAAEALREWGPTQHRHPDQIASDEDLFLLHGFPHCSNPEARRFLVNSVALFNSSSPADRSFWIMDDGSAVVGSFGVDNALPAGSFCGEVTLDAVTGLRAANLLVCSDPGVLGSSTGARTLYGALAATGAAFLAATLLVHACLPELRRSLHSSNLMAHTGSLLLAYVALTVNALATPSLPRVACLLLAFVMQFSFLAAFFWLNVMCVDISWAFSGLRLPQGSAAERDRKKFFWYSLYAWGGTAAITLLTVAMNFLSDGEPHVLHPQVGVVNCWFKEKSGVLIYFYGPMAFLLLANLILFVYTAARILAVRKDTAILHKADSSRTHSGAETQRLVLYVKLFGLMGLTWLTEIISWAAGGRDYYWYATDVINLLRAVFIFIIFCCKRKVLQLMADRFSADSGEASGSRGGRSGVGPRCRGRGRGAGTITSSLTIHQDARRLQHTASQDSNLTTVTSPSATPDGIVLSVR